MNKTKWLIEDTVFDNSEILFNALDKQSIEYKVCDYKPSQDKDYLKLFDEDDCVVACCSLQFAERIRREAKWIPGLYYNKPKYDCTSYYAHLGKYLLNDDYIMLPFGELIRRKEYLYYHLGSNDAIFLRPNAGNKLFTGEVILKENFDKKIERIGLYNANMNLETLVVASEPVNLAGEWRFIAVDGKIITGSQYRKNEVAWLNPDCPIEAYEFAGEIASAYQPESVFVVDICLTKSNHWRLMEVGCFSCAGFYECDRNVIVEAVSDAAFKEWLTYRTD